MAIQTMGLRAELSSSTRHYEKRQMVLLLRKEMPREKACKGCRTEGVHHR